MARISGAEKGSLKNLNLSSLNWWGYPRKVKLPCERWNTHSLHSNFIAKPLGFTNFLTMEMHCSSKKMILCLHRWLRQIIHLGWNTYTRHNTHKSRHKNLMITVFFTCLKVLLWWPQSKCIDRKAKKSRTKISRSLQFRTLTAILLLFKIPWIFEKVNSFITNLGQANLWLAQSTTTQTFLITAGVIDLPLGQLTAASHLPCLACEAAMEQLMALVKPLPAVAAYVMWFSFSHRVL